MKRVYREALRKLIGEADVAVEPQSTCDFVFVGKKECASVKMQEVYKELKEVVSRFKERKN
jgi:RNase P protein component